MSKSESDTKQAAAVEDDDEPDDCIMQGQADLQYRLRGGEYKDERLLLREEGLEVMQKRGEKVGFFELELFRQCWKQQQNDKRTGMKDA
ncbi:hypothetical protein LARI1_G005961 [Lachnellula arida]|uniref:Uncharacterized protein n=1 Tax=Lachnellula arida TaxID=1316785 RepID=A0A8T9B654_9HELO|nr:hypothetical protein LARI1_G005961 [Lachnellula arida]